MLGASCKLTISARERAARRVRSSQPTAENSCHVTSSRSLLASRRRPRRSAPSRLNRPRRRARHGRPARRRRDGTHAHSRRVTRRRTRREGGQGSGSTGVADLEQQIPVTPQTVFKIGSVSKQFLATGIMLCSGRSTHGRRSGCQVLSRAPQSWRGITRYLRHNTPGYARDQRSTHSRSNPTASSFVQRSRGHSSFLRDRNTSTATSAISRWPTSLRASRGSHGCIAEWVSG